jgi:hypothetical protein
MSSKIEVSVARLAEQYEETARGPSPGWIGAEVVAKQLRSIIAAPVVERQPIGTGDAIRSMTQKDWELVAANATCSQQATLISAYKDELAELQATIAQQAAEIERLKGGQGEPMAWLYKEYVWATGLGGSVWREKIELERPDPENENIKDVAPLFASQPAPVSVGIDERAEFESNYSPNAIERDGDEYILMAVQMAWEGWKMRAPLDKVKELNQ